MMNLSPEGLGVPPPERGEEPSSSAAADVTPKALLVPIIEVEMHPDEYLSRHSRPTEILGAVLEVANCLRRTLELSLLWPKIGEGISRVFPYSRSCHVLLHDPGTGRSIREQVWGEAYQLGEDSYEISQCVARNRALLIKSQPSVARTASLPDAASVPSSTVICAPLRTAQGSVFGAIHLRSDDSSRLFTADDLCLLIGAASVIGIAIENARFYEELLAQEAMELGLEFAARVQRSILPEQVPEIPDYEFFAHYAPKLSVGGDYYDFVPLPQHRLAVAVGDVAGHGIPAALLMVKLSSDVRSCLLSEPEPARAMNRLNELTWEYIRKTDRFVTLVLAVLDPLGHNVAVVNAGHPPPLLYDSEVSAWREAAPRELAGMPLGAQNRQTFESVRVELRRGDCFLCFTDGVTESRDRDRTFFKLEGVYAALQRGPSFSAWSIGRRIVRAVTRHSEGCPQSDDITLMCLRRRS